MRLALTEEVIDVDVIPDDVAGAGQAPVEGHDRVEQAVDGMPLGDEVDPEVAGEEQVGLTRLDGDAGRDPAAVEIPGAGEDVMLGDDPPARHRTRLPFDREDPIDQHQRLVGEPDPGRVRVDRRELGAEHRANGADGVLQALVAIQGRGLEFGGLALSLRDGLHFRFCDARRAGVEVGSKRGVGGTRTRGLGHQRLDQGHLEGELIRHRLADVAGDTEERPRAPRPWRSRCWRADESRGRSPGQVVARWQFPGVHWRMGFVDSEIGAEFPGSVGSGPPGFHSLDCDVRACFPKIGGRCPPYGNDQWLDCGIPAYSRRLVGGAHLMGGALRLSLSQFGDLERASADANLNDPARRLAGAGGIQPHKGTRD